MSGENQSLEIVIVGAGVAGLAVAYGLLELPGVHVRILERRKEEQCVQGGYPIHLSPEGRQAVCELLSPSDYIKLLDACNAFPASHDGITILKPSGRPAWRMVQAPGTKCLLERQDLVDILRNGLGSGDSQGDRKAQKGHIAAGGGPFKVEYDTAVKGIKKTVKGWELTLWSSELIHCDLLIGADGMFSTVRRTLYPPRPGVKDQGFEALPYTTINFRSTTKAVRSWVGDEDGMNMIYGKGWSAAFMPLASVPFVADRPVAKACQSANADIMMTLHGTIPRQKSAPGYASQPRSILAPDDESESTLCSPDLFARVPPQEENNTSYTAPAIPRPRTSFRESLWSAVFTPLTAGPTVMTDIVAADPNVTRMGRPLATQDPSHIVGATSRLHTIPPTMRNDESRTTLFHTDRDRSTKLREPNHTCYIALTIPHPQLSIRESIQSLPESRLPRSFLRDLLADPGLSHAQAFPLWTSRSTCVGAQRAVLVGDASHGMVPYCGAGASAGLKDAANLVKLLQNHILFGGNLDFLLDEFYAEQKKSNNPLIKQSRKILWIAHGNNFAKRTLRSAVFGMLEVGEKRKKERKQAQEKLKRWKADS